MNSFEKVVELVTQNCYTSLLLLAFISISIFIKIKKSPMAVSCRSSIDDLWLVGKTKR